MRIAGIGLIFSQGLGISALEKALQEGWKKPDEVEMPWLAGRKTPAYRVNLDSLPDKTLLKKVRRADKLSKMSVLAAADAIRDSGIENMDRRKLGVIVATAFGAHVTTFSFLDDILDYGDGAVSPTTFSNSVHNAAASYISSSLNIQGPTLTVTQFRFSFQSALQLAQSWLEQGRCDFVLAGAVDQFGDVLAYVSDKKLTTAKDGKIRPFTFMPTCQVPGEGAAFLLLSKDYAKKTYCIVDAVHTGDDPDQGSPVDINIIDADGMMADESMYAEILSPDVPAAAYSPLFGSMMTGSAFNCVAGALMLGNQVRYAAPVPDNPRGIRLLAEAGNARIESIRCAGYNCYREKAVVYLTRA